MAASRPLPKFELGHANFAAPCVARPATAQDGGEQSRAIPRPHERDLRHAWLAWPIWMAYSGDVPARCTVCAYPSIKSLLRHVRSAHGL